MIQIERILKDGVVDESFLKEEVICDYKVSTELKKLQAVNLDLLIQFDRICKENGLKYYLGFGTLLGAVRHKGFIPWDDDIDLLMPRHDYDIFIKMNDAFKHPYFLQTPESDPGYLYSLTKIRNSETCCIFPMRAGFGFNSGIWIDVFPLDKCMKEDRDEIFQKIDELNSFNSAYMKIPNQALNTKGKRLLKKYLDMSPRQSLDRITELSTKYKNQETPYLTDYSTTLYKWERTMWNADDFKTIIELDFCGRKFPAPQGYDNILKTTYGDYMKLPPIEKRGVWHGGHIISTEKPYKEFFDELGIEEL